MKRLCSSIAIALIPLIGFSQSVSNKSAKSKKHIIIKTTKESIITPIESLFLPYPSTYSIPVTVQESVVAILQGDPNLEQRWRDLYQDRNRLKAFLKQLFSDKKSEIENNILSLESNKNSHWEIISHWQNNLAGYEKPLGQVKRDDFQSVSVAIQGLLQTRMDLLNRKQQIQDLVDENERLYNEYSGIVDSNTKRANLDARINALNSIKLIMNIIPSLDSKIKILNDLIEFNIKYNELESPHSTFTTAVSNIEDWSNSLAPKGHP